MRNIVILFVVLFAAIFFVRKKMDNTVDAALANKNVLAFLDMIAYFESGNKANAIYGNATQGFADYSRHPNIKVPFHNPLREGQGNNDFSTAAGLYQINYPTWVMIQGLISLPDFSSHSQNRSAVALLIKDGALDYVLNGQFDAALRAVSKTWASLPYSDSGQRKTTIALAKSVYERSGGVLA